MIKMKQLLLEGRFIDPQKMRDITMAACRVVMDIDKEYMVKFHGTHTGEWYDDMQHSYEKSVPYYPGMSVHDIHYFKYKLDILQFSHFIYSFMFWYRTHAYKVSVKFRFWKYPYKQLQKLDQNQLKALQSDLWQKAMAAQMPDYYAKQTPPVHSHPKYSIERDNLQTNFWTYPTEEMLKSRHPQTTWEAEVTEYESADVYSPTSLYWQKIPPEKRIEHFLKHYQSNNWVESADRIGSVSAMGLGDLAKRIKTLIDNRGGGDEEEESPDPTPSPKDRKPTLVPA